MARYWSIDKDSGKALVEAWGLSDSEKAILAKNGFRDRGRCWPLTAPATDANIDLVKSLRK